jgi:hypothetical protein
MKRPIAIPGILALLLVTASARGAEPAWQASSEPVVRKGRGAAAKRARKPCVLRVGNSYRMWFEGYWGKQDIALAESDDGVHWRPYAHSEPVLHWTRGEGLVGGPAVLRDNRGVYHLWYTYNPENKWGGGRMVGYATSVDGIDWQRFRGNPVISNTDDGVARNPSTLSVLKHGGTYHMWMSGPGIYYATSANGIDLRAHGEVRLDKEFPGAILAPKVIRHRGRFLMAFHNYDWDKRQGTLRFATSDDGRTWTTGFLPPLEDAAGPSELLQIDGRWHVFFTRKWQIWSATIPANAGADTE